MAEPRKKEGEGVRGRDGEKGREGERLGGERDRQREREGKR